MALQVLDHLTMIFFTLGKVILGIFYKKVGKPLIANRCIFDFFKIKCLCRLL